ncbi:MAG: hypothetical protein ACP5HW_03490 [Candidatus Micrarchaeia archaeon]
MHKEKDAGEALLKLAELLALQQSLELKRDNDIFNLMLGHKIVCSMLLASPAGMKEQKIRAFVYDSKYFKAVKEVLEISKIPYELINIDNLSVERKRRSLLQLFRE